MWPCYYGTDIPDKDSLIACQHTVEEIGKMSFADSIDYLHVENLAPMLGLRAVSVMPALPAIIRHLHRVFP